MSLFGLALTCARSDAPGTDDPPCVYGYLPRGVFGALKNAIEYNQRRGKVRTVKRGQ